MPVLSRLGGLDDETRDVTCEVICDGRRWRGRGTWIARAEGPVAVLQLTPARSAGVVIEHEAMEGTR